MKVSFGQFCRLIFVVFSLYLLGDIFARWDGAGYYASFAEFLPSAALAAILWSIVSVFAAALLWALFRSAERICRLAGMEIETEHLLFYAFFFLVCGALVWKIKKLIWPYVQTTIPVKLAIFILVSGASAITTWLFRGKAGRWLGIVNERIAPIVWIFGICLVIAVPVVAYNAWFKAPSRDASPANQRNLSSGQKRPNIILVTFDALTARNMSVYGYRRDTTPFISRWSENATVFNRAEAASNFTTPSAASLMTGKRLWTHQTYHIEGMKPVRSNIESLPSILKNNGYFNTAFVVNPFASVRVLGMSDSFDTAPLTSEFGEPASLFGWKFGVIDVMLYRAFGDRIRLHNWILKNEFIFSGFLNLISRNVSQTEVPPSKAFNSFLNLVDDNLPTPFFAWIHIFPPHDPYLPPDPFRGKYNPSSKLRTYKNQEKLIEESYKYLFQHQRLPAGMRPSVDLMRDYYDEFIAYADKEFEDFIRELNKRKIENTIIVLTADHGDSFEHDYLTHGGPFMYEQVTHIPLIIKEPGQMTGQKITPLVEQIDIPATILELADISVPSWMEGRSLVPVMRGDTLLQRPAFSMNFEMNRSRGHQITKGSIALWSGDYKLIHYLEKDESLLFNIKQDPDELNNIFDKEAEKGRQMLNIIMSNLKQANEIIRNSQ
ncbi:MAG: sulfatase-like hydrolase/transferase [Nitrospirae bacterium]|nr:sulfatase-like hydrolase/transferase [Nitrospirota bacterium]